MIQIEIYIKNQSKPVYQAKSAKSIRQDKIAQLPFVPFVRQLGVINQREWAHSQENIIDKFHLIVRESYIDGRKIKAKNLPYFNWFNCLKIIKNI